ncbi:hypothetical protein C1646_759608 [Rhizophagus diaphanus]|nr:hypothetical protein C1646_759608 [Rhizophagus diaphanus] [Rhizophagus sp. MUCL 43196]
MALYLKNPFQLTIPVWAIHGLRSNISGCPYTISDATAFNPSSTKAEVYAVLTILIACPNSCSVNIYTDSQNIISIYNTIINKLISMCQTLKINNNIAWHFIDSLHCLSIPTELYHEHMCQRCGKYFPTKAFMKKHIKVHSNRKESVMQVIQKDSQPIISIKSYSKVEELTYNVEQSIDDKITTTSGVKNSMQINKHLTRGGNRHTEGDVKNTRPGI